ncbi:hypothetical protein F9C07_2285939 [Aspergillus flavus]|uniref:Uncharacterized protein n=1 Tax=Aspergillus flavus (strain ATCC 200026 / FGSC A1120 / IAM 13836 / NRRL 3357 / JCM 12722 / SRRC 167) TaxID=332952 RepID=A0A7U2R2I6_ASPFN|nr:hypothetical protein F9C07_2285939 [Aspergillus flavus]
MNLATICGLCLLGTEKSTEWVRQVDLDRCHMLFLIFLSRHRRYKNKNKNKIGILD